MAPRRRKANLKEKSDSEQEDDCFSKWMCFRSPSSPSQTEPSQTTNSKWKNLPRRIPLMRKCKRTRKSSKESPVIKASTSDHTEDQNPAPSRKQEIPLKRTIVRKRSSNTNTTSQSGPSQSTNSRWKKLARRIPLMRLCKKTRESSEKTPLILPSNPRDLTDVINPTPALTTSDRRRAGVKRSRELEQEEERPPKKTRPPPRKRLFKTNRAEERAETETSQSGPSQTTDSRWKKLASRIPLMRLCMTTRESSEETSKETGSVNSSDWMFIENVDPRTITKVSESELNIDVLDEMEAKYRMDEKIEEGGYGEIHSGIRLKDNFSVVFKNIPRNDLKFVKAKVKGKIMTIPREVFMIHRANYGGTSLTPRLLDWYDIGSHVVLVIEKPDPCMDLHQYIRVHLARCLDREEKAKIIFRQLVDAAITLEEKHIFHRDIKPQNVLIETEELRARFIDFGLSYLNEDDKAYDRPLGTHEFACPEWFRQEPYHAGPATVWQLGLCLYNMLFMKAPFINEQTIGSLRAIHIPFTISGECRDLVKCLLKKHPKSRPTLEQVRNHPWLQ